MADKNLRKTIGSRAKARRKELNLTMEYVAEKMDVNKSTIQRYESGMIDNTKKLVVEGLANVLRVSPEWLRGETDTTGSDFVDERMVKIEDTMKEILQSFPLKMGREDAVFSEDILLTLLNEYLAFNRSFEFALDNFSDGNDDLATTIGFDSAKEYNDVMFLREVTHTINTLNQLADAIRMYSKDKEKAKIYLKGLLDWLT